MPDTKQETYNALLNALTPLHETEEVLRALAERINRGAGGREVALARTKLEECGHWLDAAGNLMAKE